MTRPVSFTVPVTAWSALVSSKIEIQPVIVSCAPACITVICMVPLRFTINAETVTVSGPLPRLRRRSRSRGSAISCGRCSRQACAPAEATFEAVEQVVETPRVGEAVSHDDRR